MRKSYVLGLAFLLLWVIWIIYGLNTYQGKDVLLLFFGVVSGALVFPLYFGIVHLIVGDPRKKWISWLVIVLAPFTFVPAAYFLFTSFYM